MPFSLKTRWTGVSAIVVVAVLGGAAALVATHWPFTEKLTIEALGETFASSVEAKSFRTTFFAPGCVLEGVTFRRNGDRGVPAFATVERLTIRASYVGFFTFPKRIPRVEVEGLRVFASPQSERTGDLALPAASADQTKVIIGEIHADGAVLEFSSGQTGAKPLKFEIHKLTLNGVGQKRPMAFHAELRLPTPPGEIRTEGLFGPLQREHPGQTPASGTYVLRQADLGVFPGVGGILASSGKFDGVLERMKVAGQTDVADFEVDRSPHTVHLETQFAATVNGMNGDVALESASVKFGKTSLVAHGQVAAEAGADGKRVTLAGTQQQGSIQDWLRLLSKQDRPGLAGAMSFGAQVQVPPGERRFIERVNLQGDFLIGSADFTRSETQQAVDKLSHVALGGKPDAAPVASVEESMKGHVEMKNAVATLTDFYFGVPGAQAHMHGTYGILTDKIDLHGDLRVDSKLSKGTTGLRGVLLKVAEPFFKKKKQAEIVPIKVGGTMAHPSYGLDVVP